MPDMTRGKRRARTRTLGKTGFGLGVTLAALFGLASASGGAALQGRTYEGSAPSSGVENEGHHRIPLRAGGKIVLKVAKNGRTVQVRFTSSSPVLYCQTNERLQVQHSASAKLSQSGSFRATVEERFKAGPGAPGIVQVVTGHFSGRTVRGAIITQAGGCGGATSFSATAH